MNIFNIIKPLPYGVIPFSQVEQNLNSYASKSRLPKNAAALIVILFPYYLGEEAYKGANVSRYAVSMDYHDIVGARLADICEKLQAAYPENEFTAFCDASPLPEKKAAALAGLGVIGKNTLLINKNYGSYCFIGEIVTNKTFIGEIVTDKPLPSAFIPEKGCLGCGKCIRACPSGALSEKGLDIELCVSAITQKKAKLTESEKELIRKTGFVWGCDLCQTACPMNKNIKKTPIGEFYENPLPFLKKGCDIKGRAYAWRGQTVIERNIGVLEEEY